MRTLVVGTSIKSAMIMHVELAECHQACSIREQQEGFGIVGLYKSFRILHDIRLPETDMAIYDLDNRKQVHLAKIKRIPIRNLYSITHVHVIDTDDLEVFFTVLERQEKLDNLLK